MASGIAVLWRPLFHLPGFSSGGGWSTALSDIRDLLLDILPSNPIRPFYDGNTLQIIFLAVFTGVILLGFGARSVRLQQIISDLNDFTAQAVRIICRLLPFYIAASLTMTIWENGISTLLGMWKPVVLCVALFTVFLIVKTSVVCFRMKVKASVLLRKIFPALLVGFATASSSAAFSICSEVNERKLGIAPEYTRVGYPIGSSLYGVCISPMFVMIAYHAAETYAIGGNTGWMLTVWLTGTLLGLAVPPVSGGALVCIGILLTQLGIPGEALAAAGILSIVIDFIETGFGIGLRELELVLQADAAGMLDPETLRSETNI